MLIVVEAEERLETLREQLHEAQEELQEIASQKNLLATPPGAPAAPMDLAQCVEAMGSGLGEMFDDPRLSQEARSKKAEVEGGFIAMRSIFATLVSVRQEYDTVRQMAEAAAAADTSTAASSLPTPATDPAAGEAGGGGVATVQEGEATATAATVGTGAAPVPATVPSGIVAAPMLDGPTQDRADNRERTPPPPGNRAKAIASMSLEELAGPRKAKSKGLAKRAATVIA